MDSKDIKKPCRHENIFSLFEEARNNNGYVQIYNWYENELIKTQNDAKELFKAYFYYYLEAPWFIMDLDAHSKSNTLSKKKRDRLKEMDVSYKENGVSFNLYAFFKITEDQRNQDTLDDFELFFKICKDFLLKKDFSSRIQMVNKYDPKLRLEAKVKNNEEIEKTLNDFINKDELKNWFHFLAKELGLIGRWSYFFINENGILDEDEKYDYHNERKKYRIKMKEIEKKE